MSPNMNSQGLFVENEVGFALVPLTRVHLEVIYLKVPCILLLGNR